MKVHAVFHGTATPEGELDLPAGARTLMQQRLQALAGKQVTVSIAEYRKQRTDRQSRYYWGVVLPVIAEFLGYEKDELHEVLTMKFLRIEDDPVTGVPRRQRTPKTSTKEFAEYVDACVRFGAELGVYVPDPGEIV